jgi:hypothetical protein
MPGFSYDLPSNPNDYKGLYFEREALDFRKSTKSGPNCDNCVEVADIAGGRVVRDSKNPTGPVLAFTEGEWTAFVAGVRDGEFNR